jgi:hypothetical protein
MAPKRKTPRPVVSSTPEVRDEGTSIEAEEVTSLAVVSDASLTPASNETRAEPIGGGGGQTESGETTGRTLADLAHPYLSNRRYAYLAVFLLITLSLGSTGHLSTPMEQGAAVGLTLISWVLVWLAQRRS